jgi:hypothetical protein
MASPHTAKPVIAETANGLRKTEQLRGERGIANVTLIGQQAQRLRRIFALSDDVAFTVAKRAYGEAAS